MIPFPIGVDPTFPITAFVTLIVIIDPIGLLPVFVALTRGLSRADRNATALRATLIGGVVLLAFVFAGAALLEFVGITMPAFRIAGGILLFLTALEMLFERRSKRRADKSEEDAEDPSVFPLAIPLIAGPGAIATVILLKGQEPGAAGLTWVAVVVVVAIAVTFGVFRTAGLIERALGQTGVDVVTRLLGLLLAALSVQFVLDGLRAFGLAG